MSLYRLQLKYLDVTIEEKLRNYATQWGKKLFPFENACTAFPSIPVSMLELSPPLQILLLLRVGGLSGLNTRAVRYRRSQNTARRTFIESRQEALDRGLHAIGLIILWFIKSIDKPLYIIR
jgi:hypothetical protein